MTHLPQQHLDQWAASVDNLAGLNTISLPRYIGPPANVDQCTYALLLRCIRESLRRGSLSPHNMVNGFNYKPHLLQDSTGPNKEGNHSTGRVDGHGSQHPLSSLCSCPTPPTTPNPRHPVDRLPVCLWVVKLTTAEGSSFRGQPFAYDPNPFGHRPLCCIIG